MAVQTTKNKENSITQKYDLYNTKIKTNKNIMFGINIMLSKEGILQYTILQFIANNNQGTNIDLLVHVGIDIDMCKIILEELLKNELIQEKDGLFYITDSGKGVVIASHFRALEMM